MTEDQKEHLEQIALAKSQYEARCLARKKEALPSKRYVIFDTLYEKENECKLVFTVWPSSSNKNFIASKEILRDVLVEYFEELIADKENPMWSRLAGALLNEEDRKKLEKQEENLNDGN